MRYYLGIVDGSGSRISLFADDLVPPAGLGLGFAEVPVTALEDECRCCKGERQIPARRPDIFGRARITCPDCYGTGIARTLPPCSTLLLRARDDA